MGRPINGDLVPTTSGFANLGVDVGTNAQNAFDATDGSIRPFNHIHQVSGIYHDPLHGQSGVLRYNQDVPAFQVSLDGGRTFQNLSAGAGVDSVGVIGDADLTGNVDLATAANSGFLAIFDTSDASPIQFAVDQLALSGLWDFPTQGFNGRIVNALTDFNGTEVQGVVDVVGASGIIVDIVGQTMTIAANVDIGAAARCYSEAIGAAATEWTITHSLNTSNVSVAVYNADSPPMEITPDELEITDANTVTVRFNVAQTGNVVVVGC
jgi:hypothetical protein